MPLPAASFTFKVVGVTFVPGYPGNLQAIYDATIYEANIDQPIPVQLRRNPANPHDSNAIEVHAGGYGMLGHVPATLAARLAPELDAGHRWTAVVDSVLQWPDTPDDPGCVIRLERSL